MAAFLFSEEISKSIHNFIVSEASQQLLNYPYGKNSYAVKGLRYSFMTIFFDTTL